MCYALSTAASLIEPQHKHHRIRHTTYSESNTTCMERVMVSTNAATILPFIGLSYMAWYLMVRARARVRVREMGRGLGLRVRDM
jgi:ABC-type uncharacterized transport system permease subunit